jgi:hypothetical protein
MHKALGLMHSIEKEKKIQKKDAIYIYAWELLSCH